MKRIVDGRLFDTDEAVIVCSWHEMGSMFGVEVEAQFMLCRERVAEKPMEGLKLGLWGGVSDRGVKSDESKGDFFLAVQVGGVCGKCRIRPLDVDAARRIFEEHSDEVYDVEAMYETYFGIRPRKSMLGQLKEAFAAGAEAKQKQYEEAEARKKTEAAEDAE